MDKFKIIQLLNKVELAVGDTVMSKKVKEHINGLILDVKNEAINYSRSCGSEAEQFNCGDDRVWGREKCKVQCNECKIGYGDN